MIGYIKDKDVYALFDERGTARLHVGDIDSLERIYFPAELHVGDRAWKKAMSILDKKYAEAKKMPFVRDPLREKKRWISVTEKTPEYDMPQLALNADGDALIANYAYGEWFDTWGQDVEVTHWMPLPEAPEEGDKA